MEAMAIIGPVVSVGSKLAAAGAQRDVGRAQQAGYEQQAQAAELKGRSEAIAYKQQGSDALRNLNETLAAVLARAASGYVVAEEGSSLTTQMFAVSEGGREYAQARDNASLALEEAYIQSGIYRSAGATAMKSANVSAVASIGEAAYMAGQLS